MQVLVSEKSIPLPTIMDIATQHFFATLFIAVSVDTEKGEIIFSDRTWVAEEGMYVRDYMKDSWLMSVVYNGTNIGLGVGVVQGSHIEHLKSELDKMSKHKTINVVCERTFHLPDTEEPEGTMTTQSSVPSGQLVVLFAPYDYNQLAGKELTDDVHIQSYMDHAVDKNDKTRKPGSEG